MKDWMQQIQELNRFPSVSGDESCVQAYLREQIEPFCDQIDVDAMGNLIATLGKGIGPRVLFSAYVDTSGLLVRYIQPDGKLLVFPVGECRLSRMVGRTVVFSNGVSGILETNTTDDQELRGEDFFVDIGVATAQQASEKVPLGTFGSMRPEFFVGADESFLTASFLTNRVGIVLQLSLIRFVRENLSQLKNEFVFVFSTQKQVGNRGIGAVAFAVDPAYFIAIDTVAASSSEADKTEVQLGKGAVITVADKGVVSQTQMIDFLHRSAKNAGVDFQDFVASETQSEAGIVQRNRVGVYAAMVGVPVRYRNSGCEMICISDFEEVQKLLQTAILTGFDF